MILREQRQAGTSRQSQKQKNDLGDKFADILQKGIDTKIIVEDKESVLLRIPIIILLLLIPLWVFVLLFAILLSTLGYKFNIREEKSQNVNVNSIFQNINSKLKDNETDKNNTRKRYSKSDDNSRTQTTQNNSSNVPIEIATDISNESETHEPVNDFDNEEGYNEYTVE